MLAAPRTRKRNPPAHTRKLSEAAHKAASPYMHKPDAKPLLDRAKAARTAIRNGADPLTQLSYVVWPTPAIQQAERQTAWR